MTPDATPTRHDSAVAPTSAAPIAAPPGVTRRAGGPLTLHNWNQRQRDAWVAAQAKAIAPNSRVLDVGAGGCPYKPLFAHCRYVSQDAKPLEADQVRQGGYGAIDLVCDATAIPVAAGSFDVVLCTEVLEHVPDPAAVVREIGRVLRPGGIALVTAPLGSGLHQKPQHFHGGYTPWWYERFLGEAGFDAIDVQPNDGSFSHFAQWCLWAPSRLRRALRPANAWWCLPATAAAVIVLVPTALAARLIDGAIGDDDFTVGYFVVARRGDALP